METAVKTHLVSRDISRLIVFSVLYAISAYGAFSYLIFSAGVTAIWPASGVFLAALLLSPRSQWWILACLLGAIDFAIEIMIGGIPLLPAVIFSVSMTAQAIVSAILVQRFWTPTTKLATFRDVTALLIWGCSITVVVFAIPPALAIVAFMDGGFWTDLIAWSISDGVGVLVVCPLLLTWFDKPLDNLRNLSSIERAEYALFLIALFLITRWVFLTDNPSGTALAAYSYLPLALLFVVVFRFRLYAVTLACFVLASTAIGYDAVNDISSALSASSVLALELFLIVGVVSALFFSAVVTERESSVEALKESGERFELAMRSANEGLWERKPGTDYVYFSPRWKSMLGYQGSELTESKDLALTLIHPDDVERVEREWSACIEGSAILYGSEFRMRHKDGHWIDIKSRGVIERDAAGKAIRFVGTHTDISNQKRAEATIRQSQRMDAVGQLTGGIAHDFNNMLAIVMGNLELLQLELADNDEARDLADRALMGATRGAALTKKLLGFSRQELGEARRVSVNEFIRGMEDLISKALTVSINVKFVLVEDVWPVFVDPSDLENMILNTALNARDAMADGGTLTIETTNKVFDETYTALNPQGREGDFVKIAISDTGVGMTPDVQGKAFEPFFTTKEVGKGTGLGLSMVYGFVQRSGGYMDIYSEPGKGSVFNVYLLRALEAENIQHVRKTGRYIPLRGSETILLVDDEEMLANVAASYLENLGYKTLTAFNAKEALEAIQKNPEIDLLFSDIIMPGGMDGFELAKEFHKAYPATKILLTSGFTYNREPGEESGDEFTELLTDNMLKKPYDLNELALAIRTTFDRRL